MQEASGKTIVVTGASSGIGRQIALQLSRPGCEIWLVGRNRERLEQVADQSRSLGAVPRIVEMELSDLEAADRFLVENFPAGKRVDSIYLAAAVTLFGEVRDTLPEDWDRIYATNLLSPIQWTRHFYAGMVGQKAGTIVIISSLAAYAGYPTATAYATMKAGLLGLFRSLWYEGKSHNVDVHLASPGYVDTDIYRSATFRKTSYDHTMRQIEGLGFEVVSAEKSAERIIGAVGRGNKEFAFPAYASVIRWIAPRMPFLIKILHHKMIQKFRQTS
ncbi:MAG: SDR family NAD(P)-dependent oxidoreductase [Verrucomicrobiota bacterium]